MYTPFVGKTGFRAYGVWASNPNGFQEDKNNCVVEIHGDYQCKRRRGYGPNGEYCKQHARMAMEEKHA